MTPLAGVPRIVRPSHGCRLVPLWLLARQRRVPPQRKSNSLKATARRAETTSATLRANVGTGRSHFVIYVVSPTYLHRSSSTSFARRYRKGAEGEQPCYRCPPLPCTSFPQLATNLQPSVVLSPGELRARLSRTDGFTNGSALPGPVGCDKSPTKYFPPDPLIQVLNGRWGSNPLNDICVLWGPRPAGGPSRHDKRRTTGGQRMPNWRALRRSGWGGGGPARPRPRTARPRPVAPPAGRARRRCRG